MKYALSIISFLIFATSAYCNDASLNGTSYSIMLDDSLIYMNGYPVEFLFTTYDGDRYRYPYYYDIQNSTIYYSRELKKEGNLYYTDYYSLISGSIDDYGEISLNTGSIDSDDNGIDDICEKAKSIDANISGNWYSHTGKSGSISGSMIRNAHFQHGYYNLFINNTWAGDIPATGDFYIGVLSGNVNYSISSSTVTINFATMWDTQYSSDPLQTSFEIIDYDTVKFNGKDFFPTTNFIRDGNEYSSTVVLLDGELNTFWPDYQKWQIVIRDSNDSDGDGIPDLSDPPDEIITLPVVTTATPSSITLTTAIGGGNVTSDGGASVTAKGVCWSTASNPITGDSHTSDGPGTGSFISSIIGLSPGTTYHVRAYATNSVGTGYGSDVSFKTSYASTLYVNTDGSCGEKTPCYDSIQEAIDAASTGSVILIAHGTYDESLVLNESKALTLQPGWNSTFTSQSGTANINFMTITDGTVIFNEGCLTIGE